MFNLMLPQNATLAVNAQSVLGPTYRGDDLKDQFDIWSRPTAAQIRDAIQREAIVGLTHSEEGKRPGEMSTEQAKAIHELTMTMSADAISAGRMFDIGDLSWRDDIMRTSMRASTLYRAGHIHHPFDDASYLLFFTPPKHENTDPKLFLVYPGDEDTPEERRFFTIELLPVLLANKPILLLGNALTCTIKDGGFVTMLLQQPYRQDEQIPEEDNAKAILAPILTCLLLLATEGVGVETVAPSEKLNRARAKNGKPAIPPYFKIDARDYVTALRHKGSRERSAPAGGTHASPTPHIRRGHPRRLPNGSEIWIRDSLVNLRDPSSPLARSFYSMRTSSAS